MKCGYVHFDDQVLHNAGWYADTESSPKRFSENETGDLDNVHVWLSNMDFNIMKETNLLRNVRYRRTDFLGETTEKIAERLGFFDLDKSSVIDFVSVMPQIFERVTSYAKFYAGMEDLPQDSFRQGLRQIFIPQNDPIIDPPKQADYFREADQYFTATIRDVFDKDEEKLPLYIPPDHECDFILSKNYPKLNAGWNIAKEKGKRSLDYIGEIINNNGCGLVKLRVLGFNPIFEKFYNVGYSTSTKASSRQWFTLEEAMLLSCEAEIVEVKDILYTFDIFKPNTLKEIKKTIPERFRYSISGMIFLHNLWSCLTARNINDYKNSNYRVNTIAPFVRFYDRYLCLSYAIKLAQEDFKISGFGSGKIYISCNNVVSPQVLAGCRETGLIPPILNVKDNEDGVELKDCTKTLQVQQYLWGHGKLDVLLDYDNYCSKEKTMNKS